MAKKERIREPLSGLPTLEHLAERVGAGWKLVALEWEREAASAPGADRPLSQVADELNRRGYRTRADQPWTPSALFTLLPRMIQIGPRVFNSQEWTTRRQRLPRVV